MRPTTSLAPSRASRVALLALLLLVAPRAAGATSCAPGRLTEVRDRTDALFLGVVESVRPSFRHPLTRVVFRMRVLRTWKGVDRDRVNVALEMDQRWMGGHDFLEAARGESPVLGDSLLLSAWKEDGGLATMVCGLLWRSGRGESPVTALGPGSVPTAHASVAHVGLWWPWPAVIGVMLLLAGAALRYVRARWW